MNPQWCRTAVYRKLTSVRLLLGQNRKSQRLKFTVFLFDVEHKKEQSKISSAGGSQLMDNGKIFFVVF